MTTVGALARAGAIVSAAFFVARMLGWLRTTVITAVFGATSELDAFFAAFRIPDLTYQLVAAGALASALMPVISSLLATDRGARGWRVVSTVANVLPRCCSSWPCRVRRRARPRYGHHSRVLRGPDGLTTGLTRIMLLGPLILALGPVATSILNASNRFGAAAIAPIAYNLAIIVAAVVLGPIIGVTALAIGVVAGSPPPPHPAPADRRGRAFAGPRASTSAMRRPARSSPCSSRARSASARAR